ncbi:bifunctional ATP-dependent DNA helicase/DNA polymerase III subunit epsilon [Mannheimia haemolytica]|uniref:Bifunctional ATP-dependent DNA helicase/DNA polymerase III subunit epsilon n=1 Tax=Mannheimia haemolytica TaxID=75985 RepID=A0A378N6M6_MANHA|nr:bifunctional ATP-dependent DNA helicase/DNA polymerase III subunit epsilon [Mannheimia haemolytica]
MIFDEAHQLPDIASQYFGQSLSSRQLFDICKDTNIVYRTELKDLSQLGKAADHLTKVVQDFRLLMGGEGQIRGNLRELFRDKKVVDGLVKVAENIDFLSEVAKKSLGRSETLDKIFERLAEVKVQLKKLMDTSVTGYCYWYEANGRSFGLHITPLMVADKFGEQLKNQQIGWVFTSATLEVGGKFDHFCQRLGIENAEQLVLQSPFDYQHQSLLCVPRYLPDTNKSNTLTALGQLLKPVIEANKGRCFLLCTSYYMMRGLADFLREHSSLNVLLQGETSKSRLLEKFVKEDHSVLVATQSFWRGLMCEAMIYRW